MEAGFYLLALLWLLGLGACLFQLRRSVFVWLIVIGWTGIILVAGRVFFGALTSLRDAGTLWWVASLMLAVGFAAAAIDIRWRKNKGRRPAPPPSFPDADALRLWKEGKRPTSPRIQPGAEPCSDITP